MRKTRSVLFILAILLFSSSAAAVHAQEAGPVYVVQSGDSLYTIALSFGVTQQDLIDANQLADPNLLSAGMELVIPGLEGVSGRLVTEAIPLGIDLTGLAHYRNLNLASLVKLNRITSYAEVYAGSNLILPQNDTPAYRKAVAGMAENESALGRAASANANPWELVLANQAATSAELVPGEALFLASAEETATPSPLSPLVEEISLTPLPLIQGHTFVIQVRAAPGVTVQGSLNGSPLNFFPDGEGYTALQGIHALAEPGLAPFFLSATNEDGQSLAFDQMVLLQLGYYAQDPPLSVDPATIDPATTGPEDDLVGQYYATVTPNKLWDGLFAKPVAEPSCEKSWFGNRRSYNGSPYNYFHTGLDYGVCADLSIHAPAPGEVVFAGPLTVRGNATIIDHGWGVLTGYWHQSQILVNVGDRVETGQIIGLIGGTGRVTGPHLHWEVAVGGIQVEPLEWLERAFP